MLRRNRDSCCFVFTFVSFFLLSSAGQFQSSNNSMIKSLDDYIRAKAYNALQRQRTGLTYPVPLPANLSGIEVSAVRLRSGSLWSRGNINSSTIFNIPSGIMLSPFARRVIIIYQDLGSKSSDYYNVPSGYSLATPVVALLVYEDAANFSKQLDFRVTRNPIIIDFQQFQSPEGAGLSAGRCVQFGADGLSHIGGAAQGNVCKSTKIGRFAIVAPKSPAAEKKEEGISSSSGRKIVVIACVAGVVGILFTCFVCLGVLRLMKKKKISEMESNADDGEALRTKVVGRSKMPFATIIRTRPDIEINEFDA